MAHIRLAVGKSIVAPQLVLFASQHRSAPEDSRDCDNKLAAIMSDQRRIDHTNGNGRSSPEMVPQDLYIAYQYTIPDIVPAPLHCSIHYVQAKITT